MSDKIRILIVTESPILPTGMGETTRLLFGSLLAAYSEEFELHQIGLFNSYAVACPQWPVYPTAGERQPDGSMLFAVNDLYGQKTFPALVSKIRPHIVFAFNDPQRVQHLCINPRDRKFKLILYLNFDGFPFPPADGPILNNADLIVTMSQFSACVIKECVPVINQDKIRSIYSPADIHRFTCPSTSGKAELRARLMPEWMPKHAFILGWVGRNQWRKQIWIIYAVIYYLRTGNYSVCCKCNFVKISHHESVPPVVAKNFPPIKGPGSASFQETCPACKQATITRASPLLDIYLWIHMPDEPSQDWNKRSLEESFYLEPGKDLHYTHGHQVNSCLPPTQMPELYQIWDTLLYLSGGEGFGLPAWEAMCAGLPSVYTNYSAHAELLGRARAGLPVNGILQPEALSCIWRIIADLPAAIAAIRKLRFQKGLAKRLGTNGRRFVEKFSFTNQAKEWRQVFRQITSDSKQNTKCANLTINARDPQ